MKRIPCGKSILSVVLSAVTCLLLLLLLTLPAVVRAQDFTYTTNNGTITITKYNGSGGDVSIPSTISGLPVTTIAHGCFFSCTNVLTIAIPETVTNIDGIVFNGSTALTGFNVASANPAYCSVDGVLFNKARTSLLRCPLAKAGSYTVPNTVTTIAFYAFSQCTGLVGVSLPDTVTSIGPDAFYGCTSLTSITIPPGVINIEPWTFAFARSLTNLTILGAVTNIGAWAVHESRLPTFTLPDTVATLGAGAFSHGYFLKHITLGSGLTSIGDSAFEGAYNLTAACFRGNAPAIGTNVFGHADLVTVYYLPGTTGWADTFASRPTALWLPQILIGAPGFGVHDNQFSFHVLWTRGMTVVVEASPTLSTPAWSSMSTNTLTGDSWHFGDPDWANYPSRFYRVRSQ